jgi:hypothetical protein
MTSQYQPVREPRFSVEQTSEGEQIRIKARRQWFAMLFLPVWLTGWTFGGASAVGQILSQFEWFLAIWLCFWAAGWVVAAGTLLWMAVGSETLRVVDGDLEVAQNALGLSRRWLYEGRQIRQLRAADQPLWASSFYWQVPFVRSNRFGAVKFDYGSRTIAVAPGLDAAEGRMIVDQLGRWLPASAKQG